MLVKKTEKNKPKVLVILGPTASGKSDIAVQIAKKLNGEVISADSRQVYTGLDIGTGKITEKEMQGIPHHLIDVCHPKKVFTVAKYQKLALQKIKEILSRGRLPIIAGGTGFYIEALTESISLPKVPPNKKLRSRLEKLSALDLFKELKLLDAKRAMDIENKNEINNKVRIIRAIEIAKTLGKVPTIQKSDPLFDFVKIGILIPSEKLKIKIQKRVQAMFKQGLLKEIEQLKKSGITTSRLKKFGFEYHNPTPESVVQESIKYAKRQMTWFKRDKSIIWFSPNESVVYALKHLKVASKKSK